MYQRARSGAPRSRIAALRGMAVYASTPPPRSHLARRVSRRATVPSTRPAGAQYGPSAALGTTASTAFLLNGKAATVGCRSLETAAAYACSNALASTAEPAAAE